MTNEEFDKRMEFILGQHAQFASDIGALKDVVADIEGVVARLANASLNRFEDVDEKIAALVDSQVRGDEKIAALVDSQGRTEESLRNLISVVDRYFSDRNGGSSGPGPT
ncbi:MAG TPA: hypothetical protein VGJ55_03795 [Pyrinomonadaceae bacterium]